MLAICYLDLDEFKPVNDEYGHEAGDKVLIEVAKRIKSCIRLSDTVGRLGGDEFVILLTSIESNQEYQSPIERIIQTINQPIKISEKVDVKVGASIGVTVFPRDKSEQDVPLSHADQAIYKAKKSEKNRVFLFELGMSDIEVKKNSIH
jgi:diguanylate cyclase (GGDEF)-like protein